MELPKKLGIGGGVMFIMGIMIGWVIFPIMLKSQVHGKTLLTKDGEMRAMWSNYSFPWKFRIYLFNITNPVGIENGEKPIVQEIGPYHYDEWKEKIDLVDNEEDDTVEFNNRNTYLFNPAKSNGLTGDEELIFPHMAMLSTILLVAANKPTMLGVASKAVNSIYKKPTSIFIKATARQILFDGLPIDCTVKDFAGAAVCSQMRSASSLVSVGEDLYKFSLFGHRNSTVSSARTKVYRGIKKPNDLGKVLEWNNQSALTVWPEDHCNAYNGTEGTILHPFLYKEEDVVTFAPDLCRSLSLRYNNPTKAHGIRVNRYKVDLGDQSSNPEEKCFCPTPETCLKKGAMDLSKCIGSPIVVTLPHHYLADPSYLESVSGLHPNQRDHEMYLDLEPTTGSPLQFRISLQFNAFIFPIEKFKLMQNFPKALLPLFWFDEGIDLPDEVLNELKSAFRLIAAVKWMKWIMVLVGIGLTGAAGGLEYKRRQLERKLEVTPVAPAPAMESAKNSPGEVQKWPINISTLETVAVPPSVDKN